MARRQQKPEPQHADGAPEWMVTFSDCMTLLLTFFVLLLSFSSFDERVFWNLKIMHSKGLATITPVTRSNRDSLLQEAKQTTIVQELSKGSEKKTSEKGTQDTLLKERGSVDLAGGKVILIPSEKVFWAKGKVISPAGRGVLSLLASFLANVANRVVISEHGPTDEPNNEHYGLARAWAVSEHLVKAHALDRKQFSISAASTVPRKNGNGNELHFSSREYGRTLEIVLLDRSIHD